MTTLISRLPAIAALVQVVGCATAGSPDTQTDSVVPPTAHRESSPPGLAAPPSVTSYLEAINYGDLRDALASVDDSGDAPAGPDTAENVYRFLATGRIRLQSWRLVGLTAADDGGQWVFVVCKLALDDGFGYELPLTFHTNHADKLVFVG